MDPLSDIVTHNFHPAFGPCRNICDLDDDAAERIFERIRQAGGRALKPGYLKRRRATEDWLVRERRRKLGAPALARPIYFFLGDFADGMDPSRPASLQMRLRDFPPDALTFTFPDSMASLALANSGTSLVAEPYCGQVFTFSEMLRAIPTTNLRRYLDSRDPARGFGRFVEMQVWDDAPIRRHLEGRIRDRQSSPRYA